MSLESWGTTHSKLSFRIITSGSSARLEKLVGMLGAVQLGLCQSHTFSKFMGVSSLKGSLIPYWC